MLSLVAVPPQQGKPYLSTLTPDRGSGPIRTGVTQICSLLPDHSTTEPSVSEKRIRAMNRLVKADDPALPLH